MSTACTLEFPFLSGHLEDDDADGYGVRDGAAEGGGPHRGVPAGQDIADLTAVPYSYIMIYCVYVDYMQKSK